MFLYFRHLLQIINLSPPLPNLFYLPSFGAEKHFSGMTIKQPRSWKHPLKKLIQVIIIIINFMITGWSQSPFPCKYRSRKFKLATVSNLRTRFLKHRISKHLNELLRRKSSRECAGVTMLKKRWTKFPQLYHSNQRERYMFTFDPLFQFKTLFIHI